MAFLAAKRKPKRNMPENKIGAKKFLESGNSCLERGFNSYLERLKYDTVTLNGNSFRTAYGEAGANAGKYHRDGFTPYFTKNKVASCVNHRKNGNKTSCFNLTFS